MLENTEGAIKYGQSRETGNIWETHEEYKQTTICVEHHYTLKKNTQIR